MSVSLLIAIVAGVIVIVFANLLSRRIGVAGPLILLAVGIGVGLMPWVPAVSVAPEMILVGVLPPLLYSAAVSAPAIELRRDIGAVAGLSVLLVIVSSLVLGLFFAWAIPGIGLPLGVALGAIISPTDAVATSIVRRLGVSRRVVTVLEGESLLNDATALVLLRTAIVAAAASVSVLATLGSFAWSVLSAVVVGGVVGMLALRVRAWTGSAVANTALGLTVPYLAYLPAEALGGSGLVAAVVAGLVCGQGALRRLTPEQRISDKLNWHTIEFVLEGAVFLIMGLELYGILRDGWAVGDGLLRAVGVGAVAFVLVVVVRAVYVVPVLRVQTATARRAAARRLRGRSPGEVRRTVTPSWPPVRRAASRRRLRMERVRADLDYYEATPLTARHHAVIVWAGMRGAVTLAAAQTLPDDTPQHDLLVFVAFFVAACSLVVQGLTLPWLARVLRVRERGAGGPPHREIRVIDGALREAADAALDGGHLRRGDRSAFSDAVYGLPHPQYAAASRAQTGVDPREHWELELALVRVMRRRLHELGRSGRYSTGALRYVLDELDAYEISLKLHLDSEE